MRYLIILTFALIWVLVSCRGAEVPSGVTQPNGLIYPITVPVDSNNYLKTYQLSEDSHRAIVKAVDAGYMPYHAEEVWVDADKVNQYVLLYKSNDTCHACQANIIIIKLKMVNQKYEVERFSQVLKHGDYGLPPVTSVKQLGSSDDTIGIIFFEDQMQHGLQSGRLLIYVENHKSFDQALDFECMKDHSEANGDQYTATVKKGICDNLKFCDLDVVITGTKSEKFKLKFIGGRYQRT